MKQTIIILSLFLTNTLFAREIYLFNLYPTLKKIPFVEIIEENTILSNEHQYTLIDDLFIPSGVSLTLSEGVKIKMPELGNIIVEGQFIINGTEHAPVEIVSYSENENIRWGGICFNNSSHGVTTDEP